MGPWVDTHCHLQLAHENASVLLDRAPDVERLIVPGVDVASSLAARALCGEFPQRLRYSAGLHPHTASRWPDERSQLIELMQDAVAVGETGLDFYRNLSPREAQIASFEEHHGLALELGKPLIVHCRDAFRQVYETLESKGSGSWVVLHCWTGGPKWSKRFAELGVTFSFAGPVAFETGETVRLGAAVIDPRTVVVETDTPYLAPPPHRHENNQPANVALVGEALAKVWSLDTSEVAAMTTRRAVAVFGL